LGNIAALGVENEISEFWGDFGPLPGSRLRGVVNRYMTGWSVFGHPDANWPGLAQVIDTFPETAARLQDNPVGIASFASYLQRYKAVRRVEEELMVLRAQDFHPVTVAGDVRVRRAQQADLDELIAFYADAGSMQRTPKAVQRPLDHGYIWIAERDGKIRAAALTNAIGGSYAMIGGVYTTPAWRRYGLSQAVCSELCRALLAAGLTPTLYWKTPDAGHIYRKLGFTPTGAWCSVWLEPDHD
jgi:uncharacterized protein